MSNLIKGNELQIPNPPQIIHLILAGTAWICCAKKDILLESRNELLPSRYRYFVEVATILGWAQMAVNFRQAVLGLGRRPLPQTPHSPETGHAV